jgi:hypothetical protein
MTVSVKDYLKFADKHLGWLVAAEDVGWVDRQAYYAELGYTKLEQLPQEILKYGDNSQPEWSAYRENEREGDETAFGLWLELLARKERRKFFIFDEVERRLRHLGIKTCIELGSGQCHIAALLNAAGIETLATEIPGAKLLVDEMEGLRLEVSRQRFEQIEVADLTDVDCVLMVQVDYIFEREQVVSFLRRAAQAHCTVYIVNSQVFGLLQSASFRLTRHRRDKSPKFKRHGVMRTLGAYRQMGNEVGMTVSGFRSEFLSTYHHVIFQGSAS